MSDRSNAPHVGVIGGGITGLTAAYRLARLGYRVTLWERSDEYGGLAAAIDVPGGKIEKFYHHLFMSDTSIVALANEIGIGSSLRWLPSQNSYFSDGRIYSLASPFDLIKLPVVPFIDRIRIGLVTLYLQTIPSIGERWKAFERVTASKWLRKWLGLRAFDRTLGAQLKAKFGPRADEVAMVWFWNKIYLRTQSRPGLLAKEYLGYFEGSFSVIIDALVEAGRTEGVEFYRSTSIGRVASREDGSIAVSTDEGDELVDAVIATTPTPLLARLMPDLPADYLEKLRGSIYQGAACVLLRLDRKLTDTYWLNIADPSLPFTVVVEHTNFIDPSEYDGNHYVYVNAYVDVDHPYLSMSESELLDEYLGYLPALNPEFSRDWVQETWVFRTPAAQPVVGLNYSERRPDHRTPVPGVYLASMSQIYPEDRGTNYAVALGEHVAELLDHDLQSR
ncbi:MAG: NAD(P)/FAD-dependent oxidoreductase [Thermomicrobiales bacterium]